MKNLLTLIAILSILCQFAHCAIDEQSKYQKEAKLKDKKDTELRKNANSNLISEKKPMGLLESARSLFRWNTTTTSDTYGVTFGTTYVSIGVVRKVFIFFGIAVIVIPIVALAVGLPFLAKAFYEEKDYDYGFNSDEYYADTYAQPYTPHASERIPEILLPVLEGIRRAHSRYQHTYHNDENNYHKYETTEEYNYINDI